MQILGLIWSLVSIFLALVFFLPFLGILNWLLIPFSAIGFTISLLGSAGSSGNKSVGIAGILISLLAIIISTFRLKLGCGIL